MNITFDTERQQITLNDAGVERCLPLYSDEGFELLSQLWLKVGWNQKYTYTFTWLGRPIIQLPEDMCRIQEVLYRLRPDVIVETGIAHGGSLIFYASLFEAMGHGRVIGIDIEIRPANRLALEQHPLFHRLTLIEGSSVDPAIVARVRESIAPEERVLVILDSNHAYPHVREELRLYAPLVSRGSYVVATDGIMRDLKDAPRGSPVWGDDNPARAAEEFAQTHPAFILETPAWSFNESTLSANVTHWPSAWLRRRN